ncbi:MAG: epimerase, partial [Pyrinomonadaceae bacterium]
PAVLTLGEMAREWKRVRGVGKRVVRLPLPGALARAFRAGRNTAPDAERGVTSWEEWLARRGSSPAV